MICASVSAAAGREVVAAGYSGYCFEQEVQNEMMELSLFGRVVLCSFRLVRALLFFHTMYTGLLL